MWPQSMFGEWQPLPVLSGMHGAYLAQVIEISAPDHSVQVLLPDMSAVIGSALMNGCKAHVLEQRASEFAGEVGLPRKGDWGVVMFAGGSTEQAVWMGSLYKDASNLCTEKADTHLTQYEDGSWYRITSDGTVEFSHPSGTYLRMGTGTALGARTRRERQGSTSRVVPHAIPSNAAPTFHVQHASGAFVTIDPAGEITIEGESGAKMTITPAGDMTVEGSSGAHLTIAPDGEITVMAGAGKFLHLAGVTGEDFLVLRQSLDKILAEFNAHIHQGVASGMALSGTTNTPMAAFIPDIHFTTQALGT